MHTFRNNIIYLNLFKKAITFFTAAIFLFSIVSTEAFSVPFQSPPESIGYEEVFELPEYLGKVKDSWMPSKGSDSPSPSIVIQIQDAHCDYNAQHKISEIIKYLNSEYGITRVNLEGGRGEYDFSVFNNMVDSGIRRNVSDFFVKEGIVNGGEFFAINNPGKVSLWGVENTSLYINTLDVYRDSLKYKSIVNKYLDRLSGMLEKFNEKIFNKKLLEFVKTRTGYKNEELGFKEYLEYLINHENLKPGGFTGYPNISLLIAAIEKENNMDFKKADKERERLIKSFEKKLSKNELSMLVQNILDMKHKLISRTVFYEFLRARARESFIDIKKTYPELFKYIDYVSSYDRVTLSECMEELENLEINLENSLAQNDKQRELLLLDRNLDFIRKMFGLELVYKDFKYYEKHKDQFKISNFISFYRENGPGYGISIEQVTELNRLDVYMKDILRFYYASFKRDKAFIKNLEFGTIRLPGSGQEIETALLVTGGFHTENILRLLKEKGVSYISILPNFITEEGYENPYFSILSGKRPRFQKMINNAFFAMQVPSLLNELGIEVSPGNSELMRIAAIALSYSELLNKSFAVKTTEKDEYVIFQKTEKGPECFVTKMSRSDIQSGGLTVVNEAIPVVRNNPGQILWAFSQIGHDLLVRQAEHIYLTTEDAEIVDTLQKYIKNLPDTEAGNKIRVNLLKELEYLLTNERDLPEGGRKPSMLSIVPGLISSRAGGQGIYIAAQEEQVARVILHELLAGIYGPAGHELITDLEQALVDGKGDKNKISDGLSGKETDIPVWRLEEAFKPPEDAAMARVAMDRDYASWLKKIFGKTEQPEQQTETVKVNNPAHKKRTRLRLSGFQDGQLRVVSDESLLEALDVPQAKPILEGSQISITRPKGVPKSVKVVRESLSTHQNLIDANFEVLAMLEVELTPGKLAEMLEKVKLMMDSYLSLTTGLDDKQYKIGELTKRWEALSELLSEYTSEDKAVELRSEQVKGLVVNIQNSGSLHKFVNDLHQLSFEPLFRLAEGVGANITINKYHNNTIEIIDATSNGILTPGGLNSELVELVLQAIQEANGDASLKIKLSVTEDTLIGHIRMGAHSALFQMKLAEPDDGGMLMIRYLDPTESIGAALRRKYINALTAKLGMSKREQASDKMLDLLLDKDRKLDSIHTLRRVFPLLLRSFYNTVNLDCGLDLWKFKDRTLGRKRDTPDETVVGKTVNMFIEQLRIPSGVIREGLYLDLVAGMPLPPDSDKRRAINEFLDSLGIDSIPETELTLTQRVVEKYINEPVDERLARGELVWDGGKLAANSAGNYHPVEDIVRDVTGERRTQVESIKTVEVLSFIEDSIVFSDIGIVGSLVAQVGVYKSVKGETYVISALRDPKTDNMIFARVNKLREDGTFKKVSLMTMGRDLQEREINILKIQSAMTERVSKQEIDGSMAMIYAAWPEKELASGDTMLQGVSISPGISSDLRVTFDKDGITEGNRDVLLTENTTPEDTAVFPKIPGIVVASGGVLSHAGITARELGIPGVMLSNVEIITREDGTIEAWDVISYSPLEEGRIGNIPYSRGILKKRTRVKPGDRIRVDGDDGTIILISGKGKIDAVTPETDEAKGEEDEDVETITDEAKGKSFSKVEVVTPTNGDEQALVVPLEGESELRSIEVGGKGKNLREISSWGTDFGFQVPSGMLITSAAFSEFVKASGFFDDMYGLFEHHKKGDISLSTVSAEIQKLFLNASEEARAVIAGAIESFFEQFPEKRSVKWWAVRSSNIAEDSGAAAFAGAGGTDLFQSRSDLVDMVIKNFSTFATERALEYRLARGMFNLDISQPVVIQEMVNSEVSGIVFTVDPTETTQGSNVLVINASHGLGEGIVSGLVQPDQYIVDKKDSKEVQRYFRGAKRVKVVQRTQGDTEITTNSPEDRRSRALTRKQVQILADASMKIRDRYQKKHRKIQEVDIEFAFVGDTLYILQVRPETTTKTSGEVFGSRAERNAVFADFMSLSEITGDMLAPSAGGTTERPEISLKYTIQTIREACDRLADILARLENGGVGLGDTAMKTKIEQYISDRYVENPARRYRQMQKILSILLDNKNEGDQFIIKSFREYLEEVSATGTFSKPNLIGKISGKVPESIKIEDSPGQDTVLIKGIIGEEEGSVEVKKTDTESISSKSLVQEIRDKLGITDPEEKPGNMDVREWDLVKSLLSLLNESNIVVIEDRPDIRGAIDPDTSTIYLAASLVEDPLAIIHELGEGFAGVIASDIFEQQDYKDLTIHTLMRGLGEKAGRALLFAVKRGALKARTSPEKAIEIINSEMERLNVGRSLSESEQALIRYNLDRGRAGEEIAYGIQDLINVEANRILSSRINEWNTRAVETLVRDMKQGFVDAIICPSTIEMRSSQKKVEKDCSRRYKRNYGSETSIDTYDYNMSPEDRVNAILSNIKEMIERFQQPEYRNKLPRIAAYLNQSDMDIINERIQGKDESVLELQQHRGIISFLADDIPEDGMYEEAKLIVLAKSFLNYKRLKEDLGADISVLSELQRHLIEGLMLLTEQDDLLEELKDPAQIDAFIDRILNGEILLKITRIDYETIKKWAKAQEQVARSL